MTIRLLLVTILLLGVLAPRASTAPRANDSPDALILRAFELAHNLDQDQALDTARLAVAADPQDPAAHRTVAAIAWLKILFLRGVVTFDDYIGQVSTSSVPTKAPPADLAATFRTHIDRSLELAGERVRREPDDADAHYQMGASLGLLASYAGTVEGRVVYAVRAARRAFNAHEKVLELAPDRKDAALIPGMYRYGVSKLSLPLRLMAYVAGFGGGHERGIQLVEDASRYRKDLQTDALYPLLIIYVREGRYTDAARVVGELQRLYPGNRLLWLNAGAVALLADRFADSEAVLTEGLARLERDPRPRAFGEEAVWRCTRGAARVALGRVAAAEADLRIALAGEARDWVRGRAHTELGKLADLAGHRVRAREEYQRAISFGEADRDDLGVAEAKRLRRSGYRSPGVGSGRTGVLAGPAALRDLAP